MLHCPWLFCNPLLPLPATFVVCHTVHHLPCCVSPFSFYHPTTTSATFPANTAYLPLFFCLQIIPHHVFPFLGGTSLVYGPFTLHFGLDTYLPSAGPYFTFPSTISTMPCTHAFYLIYFGLSSATTTGTFHYLPTISALLLVFWTPPYATDTVSITLLLPLCYLLPGYPHAFCTLLY